MFGIKGLDRVDDAKSGLLDFERGEDFLEADFGQHAPAFAGQALSRAQPLCWEHEGNRAIRIGQWKPVSKFPADWELYDLDADRIEQHDLAAREPARVREMSAQWGSWARQVGVMPWPEIQGARSAVTGQAKKKGAAAPK